MDLSNIPWKPVESKYRETHIAKLKGTGDREKERERAREKEKGRKKKRKEERKKERKKDRK